MVCPLRFVGVEDELPVRVRGRSLDGLAGCRLNLSVGRIGVLDTVSVDGEKSDDVTSSGGRETGPVEPDQHGCFFLVQLSFQEAPFTGAEVSPVPPTVAGAA